MRDGWGEVTEGLGDELVLCYGQRLREQSVADIAKLFSYTRCVQRHYMSTP